jgi:hypothetical protein
MMARIVSANMLMFMLLLSPTVRADFWVNEINYESSPGVEIIMSPLSQGTNLNNVIWWLYDGATGTSYANHALSTFSAGASANNYTVFSLTGFAIQSGNPSGQPDSPDGWAISVNGAVVEFKSYEGTFTASAGVAAGLTSMDIGVRQNTGYPTQSSSQLQGTGNKASDFNWIVGQGPSYGQVNLGQTLTAVPEPSSLALLSFSVAGVYFGRRKTAFRRS